MKTSEYDILVAELKTALTVTGWSVRAYNAWSSGDAFVSVHNRRGGAAAQVNIEGKGPGMQGAVTRLQPFAASGRIGRILIFAHAS